MSVVMPREWDSEEGYLQHIHPTKVSRAKPGKSHLSVMTFLALNTILSQRKKIVGKQHCDKNTRRADFREE